MLRTRRWRCRARTGAVEILSGPPDKPITELKTTVTRDDGVVALEGRALCYTMPLVGRRD